MGGVYCYENGRAAFSRGCSTITNNVTWQSINAFNNILGAHEPRSTEQRSKYMIVGEGEYIHDKTQV